MYFTGQSTSVGPTEAEAKAPEEEELVLDETAGILQPASSEITMDLMVKSGFFR